MTPPTYTFDAPDTAEITGADISAAYDHSDGSIYWTCQIPVPHSTPQQAVYHLVNGHSTRVPLDKTVTGRGQFCILGGFLYLTAWNEAESPKKGYGIPVVQCKEPELLPGSSTAAPIAVPADSPLWQVWEGIYTTDRPPSVESFNKLKAAFLAFRDALVAQGALIKV